MKETMWYNKDTVPGVAGLYQTCYDACLLDVTTQGFQYWNGLFWGMFSYNPEEALEWWIAPSEQQDCYWRGLKTPCSDNFEINIH